MKYCLAWAFAFAGACCDSCSPLLATVCAVEAALAQLIPGSAQPGREREQLIDRRTAPRVQPGGVAISLPSTEAPAGAAQTTLTIRRVQIVGATVYSDEQFAPLYRDVLNRQVTLEVVYDIAKRITAKYGADGYVLSRAIVPPQELTPGGATIRIQVIEGYVSKVEWPREKLARYRDFFSDYTAKIIADRPTNIRTLERYLLLANDLPGLKFTTTLQASKTEQGAAGADRRGHREDARRQCALRQPRHQGARAVPVPGRADLQQSVRHARGDHVRLRGHDADRGIAVRRPSTTVTC